MVKGSGGGGGGAAVGGSRMEDRWVFHRGGQDSRQQLQTFLETSEHFILHLAFREL